MEEEKILDFCGCELVLKCDNPEHRHLQTKFIDNAKKIIRRVFADEFGVITI